MFAQALVGCLFLASIFGVTGRPAVSFDIKVSPAAQSYYLQIPTVLLPTQVQLPTVQLNYTYTAITVSPTVAPLPTATYPVPTVPAFTVPTQPPPLVTTTTPASFRLPTLPTLSTATVLTPAAVDVATQLVNCLGLACYTLLPLAPYSYSAPAPAPAPYSDFLPYNWSWRGGWPRCYWFFC